MRKIPCFMYREGEHFTLPGALRGIRRSVSEFCVCDANGRARPSPEVFEEVDTPDAAQLFLFPLEIGQYIDSGNIEAIAGVIGSLPWLAGREERHLVCDTADTCALLPQPVCLFKFSLSRRDAARAVPMWYTVPAHSLAAPPCFSWEDLRYEVAFVGSYTNPLRKAAVLSLRTQAPELRFFLDVADGVRIRDGVVRSEPQSATERKRRQEIFLRSMRESLSVLCPPGVGPQSVRFYETMRFGRIPVIFTSECVYPLEDKVDYDAFCLRIPAGEALDTGRIVRNWLAEHDREELYAKCLLACRAWGKFFHRGKLRLLLEEAAGKFGFTHLLAAD